MPSDFVNVYVRVPRPIHDRGRQVAERNRITLNTIVGRALDRYCAQILDLDPILTDLP